MSVVSTCMIVVLIVSARALHLFSTEKFSFLSRRTNNYQTNSSSIRIRAFSSDYIDLRVTFHPWHTELCVYSFQTDGYTPRNILLLYSFSRYCCSTTNTAKSTETKKLTIERDTNWWWWGRFWKTKFKKYVDRKVRWIKMMLIDWDIWLCDWSHCLRWAWNESIIERIFVMNNVIREQKLPMIE